MLNPTHYKYYKYHEHYKYFQVSSAKKKFYLDFNRGQLKTLLKRGFLPWEEFFGAQA